MSLGELEACLKSAGENRFNPLFIGACLWALRSAGSWEAASEFQSPLHRGMSLGAAIAAELEIQGFQFPLHRGMSLSDAFMRKQEEDWKQVSIPSLSGHVFVPTGSWSMACGQTASFNPLFIGACLWASGLRAG